MRAMKEGDCTLWNSLAVQWLALCAFTAEGARVQSLVGELRSCEPHGTGKKKKTTTTIKRRKQLKKNNNCSEM